MLSIKWLRSFYPSQLPQGMTQFNEFVADVAQLSGLPDNDRLRKVISEFIFTLPPDMPSFSKRRLAKMIQKAAANQVAHEVLKLQNENKETKTECEPK